MEKTLTLGQAVSDFEDKFRRFRKSGGKDPQFLEGKTKEADFILPEKERYKKSVIETYKKFISPFQVFGKSSAIADQLERDKENLVSAYNLYHAVHEVNQKMGSPETYIKSPVIESPLTKRERYTTGGEFIYLQCWFMYEHKAELVPQLEYNEKTDNWKLTFVPKKRLHATTSDLEIDSIIQECFYPVSE